MLRTQSIKTEPARAQHVKILKSVQRQKRTLLIIRHVSSIKHPTTREDQASPPLFPPSSLVQFKLSLSLSLSLSISLSVCVGTTIT